MYVLLGIGIGLALAAALYAWKSDDKPAKAVRSVFKRGGGGGPAEH